MAATAQGTKVARLAITAATIALAAAGCTGASDGDVETATIEALDAAVGPAVQALLDPPALEATTLWFDGDGEHIRTDWLDYRADNTFLMVTQLAGPADGPLDEMAIIQIAGERFCATAGPNLYCDVEDPQTNESWAAIQPLQAEATATRIPISLDLEAMAAGGGGAGANPEVAVTRQQSDGGEVTWVMISPGDGSAFTQEWTIGSDGSLRSYAAGAETGLPFGLYSKTQFDFVVVNDAEPVDAPSVGSPLDIGSLGLPPDVPLFD